MSYLYVGTYTGGPLSDHRDTDSEGIYCFDLDDRSGALTNLRCVSRNEIDPGFVTIRGNILLSENERKDMGTVRSYGIEKNGDLTFKDAIEAEGSKCAFISFDKDSDLVFATNYASGSVMLISCDKEGDMRLLDKVQHYGKSIIPIRQDYPRAHSARITPDRE